MWKQRNITSAVSSQSASLLMSTLVAIVSLPSDENINRLKYNAKANLLELC